MNIKRFIRWVIDNFFILLLAVYSLLYARWFLVSPIDDSSIDLGTFAFGFRGTLRVDGDNQITFLTGFDFGRIAGQHEVCTVLGRRHFLDGEAIGRIAQFHFELAGHIGRDVQLHTACTASGDLDWQGTKNFDLALLLEKAADSLARSRRSL